MKTILIVLLIFTIAVFTGTWIFGGLSWLFDMLSAGCQFLEKTFNLFGWNKGLLM